MFCEDGIVKEQEFRADSSNKRKEGTEDEAEITVSSSNCESNDSAVVNNQYSKPNGLYVHYFLQSFLKEFINGTSYAFFVQYLNSPSHMSTAVRSFWNVLWSFKFVFAILSDVGPVCGLKRKPYIVLGWSIAFVGLISAFLVPFPESYYSVDNVNGTCQKSKQVQNSKSTDYILAYVLLLGMAKFGVAIMDCAADGKLVELTKNERRSEKGSAVSIGHLTQKIGIIVTSVIIIVSLNKPEYGGKFCFGLSFKTLIVGFAMVPPIAIVVTLLQVDESRVSRNEGIKLKFWLQSMWLKLQESVVSRVSGFIFIYVFSYRFRSPANVNIARSWAQVSPMTNAVFRIISLFLHSIGIFLYKRYLLNVNWRYLVVFGVACCVVPNLIVEYIVIFDYYRNEYFYFVDDVLEAIPEGILYIIIMQIAAEICGKHLEGSLFALMMSVYTIALAVSGSLSNLCGSYFDVSYPERFSRDSENDRFVVFVSVCSACGVKFVLLPVALVLLPRQREHLNLIRKTSKCSAFNASLFVLLFACVLGYSMMVSFFAVYERTSCLTIAGGKGC
ncbi:folate-biopterin transporter-like [Convolutriloba macropyga]|uniref:folate-biopterin transporter-like n=1 Tax=Convolutriloba macropyga TaxID=536237 RepID=UPI003F520F39